MIYSVQELCGCGECREDYNEAQYNLKGIFCVVLVSSGSASCKEAPQPLQAGSLLIFSQNLQLSLTEGTHIIFASLTGAAAEKAALGLSRAVVSDCGICPMAAEILKLMLDEANAQQRSKLSFELLCELSGANEKGTALPPLVAQAISEMHKNHASLFGIEELSQSLGVSKSHLVRTFSQCMGIPPGQYLTRVRIDSAKLLLSQRNYPLELIATLCGFSGANYLCKVFRRETGQTPAAFRRMALGKASPQSPLTDLEGTLFV